MKNSILVVGSVALDSVQTAHGRTTKALGGSAGHFSMAASQFAPVSIVGVVGEDFPEEFRRMLERKNINLDGMKMVPGKTFHWKGSYDKNYRNATTISTQLNVFEHFKPELHEAHKACEILFLANIDPDLQMSVLRQMKKPSLVACDTMNYWISLKRNALRRLLSMVHLLFVNEEEARQLTKEHNIIKAARLLTRMGPRIIIIKKGDSGAMLFYGGRILALPAYPVEKVVDPTGAGDTFAGGFLGYLGTCANWTDFGALKKAMAYGMVFSAFNVEDFSVRRIFRLTRAEIGGRYSKYVELLSI
ncbi:MAG: PfkB family carbohydrate kinase [bacterium]